MATTLCAFTNRVTSIWQHVDIRGAIRGREVVAAVALSSLAFSTLLIALLHVGVATLDVTLQRDLGVGGGEVVQVEGAATAAVDEVRVAATMLDRSLGPLVRSIIERRITRLHGAVRDRVVEVIGASASLPRLQAMQVREGRWFSVAEQRGERAVALLGRALVDSLYSGAVPRDVRLGGRTLQVIGVVESGDVAPVTLDRAVIVTLGMLRRLSLPGGAPPSILIRDTDHANVVGVQDIWRRLERKSGRYISRLSMFTARQRLGEASKLAGALHAGASALSALLAAASSVTVAALMLTIARGHARSVGLMRAVGATRTQVVMHGVAIGAAVGAVGVGGGMAVAQLVALSLPAWFALPAVPVATLLWLLAKAAVLPWLMAVCASAVCFARLGKRTPASLLA